MQDSNPPANIDSNNPSVPEMAGKSSTPENGTSIKKTPMLIVFLVVFIDLLGFGIVIPLLSLFGDRYLVSLLGDDNEIAVGLMLGLLMSCFSAMQFLFAPLWGRISDSVGRRPILLLGLAGSVIFYSVFGYASDLPESQAYIAVVLLFIARIGAGIAGATIATAQAVIADCTPPDKRKIGMAMIGAAFGIGFTFGPLIGFACLTFYPEFLGLLGYVAAGLSLISLLLGLALLPETRQFRAGEASKRKWFSIADSRKVLQVPTVGLLILIFFLTTIGFSGFEPTLALLNKEILQLDRNYNLLVFAYVGVVLMLTQGVLYRRLAKRFSEELFMTIGIIAMGSGLLLLGFAVGSIQMLYSETESIQWELMFPAVLASLTLAVVGFAFLTPSVQALISRRSDPEKQGEILGVNQSASALARIVGPVVGIVLYKIPGTYHMLPYAFGALILFAMLLLLPRLKQKSA